MRAVNKLTDCSKSVSELHSNTEELALFLKAAGDPLRLEILRSLKQDSFGVQELAFIFSLPQPGMSHHLKVLNRAGLLNKKRHGNSIFYRRPLVKQQHEHRRLLQHLYQNVDRLTLSTEIKRRIQQVYRDRSKRSFDFFERHARQFKDKQAAISQTHEYLNSISDLFQIIEVEKNAPILEVGPGHGELLKELSKSFNKLHALDNSVEMLAQAQQNLASESKKISYHCASLEEFTLENSQIKVAILNMVLHHLSSPVQAFKKLSQLLEKDAYLIVVELCAHDQEWVKENCGDLWMGFEPQELLEWAQTHQFERKQELYLGLKNGFQIQLSLFQKLE